MKRNKSGNIYEEFTAELELKSGDMYSVNYSVHAWHQEGDSSCTDSDWDFFGGTEINEVKILNIELLSEEGTCTSICETALPTEVQDEINTLVYEDAEEHINEMDFSNYKEDYND